MIAALCLSAGTFHVSLPITSFTLRWQHSIEKVEWDEDYELVGPWLHLSQARIRGSGAGMEPPPDAVLSHGVWHYRVADPWRRELVVARSEFVADYELCIRGNCHPLSRWVPVSAGATTLAPCNRPGPSRLARPASPAHSFAVTQRLSLEARERGPVRTADRAKLAPTKLGPSVARL